MADRVIEELERDECLRLIAAGGVGRIAYTGRFGPAVLPVNYILYEGAILFRTAQHSPLDEDLRTGITDADFKVAFEIDDIDLGGEVGWSVLVQGPAHHVTGAEREAALNAGVEAWAPETGNCSSGSSRPASPAAASAPPRSRRLGSRWACLRAHPLMMRRKTAVSGNGGTQTHNRKGRKFQTNITSPDLNTPVKKQGERESSGLALPPHTGEVRSCTTRSWSPSTSHRFRTAPS